MEKIIKVPLMDTSEITCSQMECLNSAFKVNGWDSKDLIIKCFKDKVYLCYNLEVIYD